MALQASRAVRPAMCSRLRLGHRAVAPCIHPYPSQTLSWTGRCRATDGEDAKSEAGGGGEGLEELLAQELKKRGMTAGGSSPPPPSAAAKNPFASTTTRPRAPPPPKINLDGTQDQRQRSMNMVNEGLEGLIPRASQLIQLGGSVFLAFLPFMLAISLLFSGVYFVFGDSFVHRGSPSAGPPVYIDPDKLLSESTVDPYVPYSTR